MARIRGCYRPSAKFPKRANKYCPKDIRAATTALEGSETTSRCQEPMEEDIPATVDAVDEPLLCDGIRRRRLSRRFYTRLDARIMAKVPLPARMDHRTHLPSIPRQVSSNCQRAWRPGRVQPYSYRQSNQTGSPRCSIRVTGLCC